MEEKVILYSTGCPRCTVLKRKLDEKGVVYQEIEDVDEMMKLDIMEVPVLYVGGVLMNFTEAIEWVNGLE